MTEAETKTDAEPEDNPEGQAEAETEVSAEAETEVEAEGKAEIGIGSEANPDHDWYVVQTYSGYESRVQQSLLERVKALGLESSISDVQVPSEEVLEIRGGKKRKSNRKFFPGYVLVATNLTDEIWHLIKEIPKVTGFVGGRKPTPLAPEEVSDLVYRLETGARPPRATVDFAVGDSVRIIEGPFSGFVANVDEVLEAQSKLKVMVTIFGRSTPVELGFLQVEAA
ncbi:MAG: transcription termination/antitermination protein NusG [Leptospirillia bacterium]